MWLKATGVLIGFQYLIKASHQALRLLDDTALYTPLHHALDVLLLILLWHGDICTARLQLALCDLTHTHTHTCFCETTLRGCASLHKQSHTDLSEHLLVDGEGQVQHVLYVIVLHPLKTLMKLLIKILQIAQITRSTHTCDQGNQTECVESSSSTKDFLKKCQIYVSIG